MNVPHHFLLVAGLAVVPAAMSGDGRSLHWWSIDGGGATLRGGNLTLHGTIGQADAQTLTGNHRTLVGGFLALPFGTGPTTAPTLRIQAEAAGPGAVTIYWAPAAPGWVLQTSPSLLPALWSDAPSGSQNPVTITAAGTNCFYRLRWAGD